MIEWINEYFNIENEVSLPILISLLVFITGGLIKFLIDNFRGFLTRKKLRKTFTMLNEQMIKDLSRREKAAQRFYPQLDPKNKERWNLKYSPLSYLNTYFDLNFQDLYLAFNKKHFWYFRTSKTREKAFHKIWSELRTLDFYETKLDKDLDLLIERFKTAHSDYNEEISKIKDFHVQIVKEYNSKLTTLNNLENKTQTGYYFNIWKRFSDIEESQRIFYFTSYNFLIRSLIDFAKSYPQHPLSEPMVPILVSTESKFNSIKSLLGLYRDVFKDYYTNYRKSKKIIEKANSIV